ncbi:energy-coupling factor ABC transporter ATP-binding protein [Vibrio sonorensis]|uniref:energy-coupling factor ABC transporter ATP-binding protein n=1 Tax=Vibrio sonorensis TaxID=1004316 RepID=UPI0008DA1EA6|nr:ABC transporter ATP-binding protein [Vibrio sonorensis]
MTSSTDPISQPSSSTTSIDLTNVSFAIEGKTILDNLTVQTQAKRLGIIGRNGSGKSTLCRVLSGLVEIESGELSVSGINPYKDRKRAIQEIGMLFQNPDHQIIFPTVLEEIAFGLRQLGNKKKQADQMALDVLTNFGKSHWQSVHTSTLSQGQKHLVCLMAVAAMNPNLIILDEPFAGLDIPTKKQLQRYLDKFEGSLIHISHDPQDLENYQTLLWLEGGKVAAMGSKDEILPKYLEEMHRLGESDDISDLSN